MKKRDIAIGAAGAVAAIAAIKLLTRPETVYFEDVADDVLHSENSDFVNVDGVRIHFQEFGDETAPTLLLIHGYTASTYVWNAVAPMLADEGFRVIAIDLVGFGFSEKPRGFDYTIQSQAHMASRFLDMLGIGRATVVGSSYGGAVAATLALDYAERVEKLVLVDTVCNDKLKDHPILRLASIRWLGEVITPFVADSKRFLRHRMHGTLATANHHLITPERIDSIYRPLAAADGHHSLLATSRNWDANRIEDDADLIRQPTLIIWGDQDSVTPIDDGFYLHEAILNSRMVVFKDCGHVPQEEKSDLFVEIVEEFCRDKRGRITSRGTDEMRVEQ